MFGETLTLSLMAQNWINNNYSKMIKGKIRFLFFTKSNSNHFINQKVLNIKKNQLKKVATKLNHMSNNIRL
jgi:hypothetical protein